MSDDAYEAAMSNDNLTSEERRNLELTKAWSEAYGNLDNIDHFCDLYADNTEIYTPLQDWYWAKHGHSTEPFRSGERLMATLISHREEKIVSILAQGDTVAVQVSVEITSKDGNQRQGSFAAFLKFDEDGKIVSDHSFLGRHPRPTPEEAGKVIPAFKPIIEKLLEINP